MSDSSGFSLCKHFLEGLISIPSVNPPGNELEAAEYVSDMLTNHGIPCEIQNITLSRANVVSVPINDVPAILLSGHLDVVPAGGGWNTNPFQAVESGNRIWGRGSCDMKGGVAAMMAAAVWAIKQPSHRPFRLAFVADEELSGTGMQKLLPTLDPRKVRYTVLGEPTMNQIHIAHRGAIRSKLRIHGRSCHGSSPQLGKNAIELTARLIEAIRLLNEDFKTIKQDFLPCPTICCTMISAGTKDNIVPDLCELIVDYRPVIGGTPEGIDTAIRKKLNNLGGLPEGTYMETVTYINSPACSLDVNSEIVLWAKRVFEISHKEQAQIASFPACCDLCKFMTAGFPTILYGPGSIEQAHTDNEYVDLDQLRQAYDFYCNCLTL